MPVRDWILNIELWLYASLELKLIDIGALITAFCGTVLVYWVCVDDRITDMLCDKIDQLEEQIKKMERERYETAMKKGNEEMG